MKKKVELEGSPYEMGKQHGELFSREIRDWYEEMYKIWLLDRGLSPGKIKSLEDRLYKFLKVNFPDLVEEMKGISAGAGMSEEEIFLLNTFPALSVYKLGSSCTAIAFKKSDRGPLSGQNYDLGKGRDIYFLKVCRPNKGFANIGFGYVGEVWGGEVMNEHGLCFGSSSVNGVRLEEPWREGLPVEFLRTIVLRTCKNVKEGVELLRKLSPLNVPRNGVNFLLVDGEGEMVVVEKLSKKMALRKPDDGFLRATNFFASRKMEPYNDHSTQYARDLEKNARDRYWRIGKSLEGKESTLKKMKEVLRSHNYPGAVCRHPETKGELGCTTLSSICIPYKKKILFLKGSPCEKEYQNAIL